MQVSKVKSNIRALILMLSGILLLSSCVKEYWPDLKSGSDNLLVIDGKISNDPGPYTVKLSISSPIQNPEFNPVTNAVVTIIDENMVQEVLTETSSGIYQTAENGIQGEIGHRYKLSVITKAGGIYESDFEELLDPVGVASVSYKQEIQSGGNANDEDITGYQFYLSTEVSPLKQNYYYWELQETYEYHSAYNILFYYDGVFVYASAAHPLGLPRTIDHDTLYYCWLTSNAKERYTYTTEYLSVPIVENLSLHFIPFNDERLQQKYSLLAKQFTISAEAYLFFKALEEQNSDQDELITSQPYQIRGNMRNINDSEEAVLGYFLVAGVADGPRIFVKAPQYYHLKCGADTLTYNILRYITTTSSSDFPLYFTYVYFSNPDDPMAEAIEALALIHQECLDCTKRGGVPIKPDFWE
ncbi:MAG: DUF4249 domain-containing protein [Bacteroidales bacterium]|nr:DUF4249 domain-containing protein [Bacteroidales bacterium]